MPRCDIGNNRSAIAIGIAITIAMCLLLSGCTKPSGTSSPIRDPSARYFSTSPPSGVAVGAGLPAVASTEAAPVVPRGPVSRPDPTLTPGAVAITDVNAICSLPRHQHAHIPGATQAASYARYGLAFPSPNHAYSLDYLVPLNLGGASTLDNLWPAKVDGVGFHEKQQLNQRIRLLVCSGQLALKDAQHRVAADWYATWLNYANK